MFIVFYICYKKNKYRKYALGINIIFLFALMGYLFINLDSGSIILINAFIKNICKLKIYDVEAFKIIGVSAIICYLLLYAIQENKKSFYIKQSFVFVIQGIIYLILLILSYSQFSQYEALKSASLSRYLSSFIFYIFIAAISVLLCKEDLWDNIKCKTISVSILLIFVISTIFPAPLTLFNYERNCIYKYTYNYEAQNFGNNIKKLTNKDDKIFVVSQKDDGYRQFLMKYYCLPLTINNKYYSLGPSKYEGDIWSKKITINQFKDYLIENNFTHVFLYTIDDYFIETYGVLFDDKSNIVKGKLFKININGGLELILD